MRLSTTSDRDESRGVAVIHAALDAGVTLLDTADAYALDDADVGHNERLVARALAEWNGDRSRVTVATKGGLVRPSGRWVENGKAKHLVAACERSRPALGVERIDLYQLHAPDPRTPLKTSVRALAALQRDGLVAAIGLSNVTLRQLQEAREHASIASVQVEIGVFEDESLRNGVAEYCLGEGILLLAQRPLGGAAAQRRLERDPLLRELAEGHACTPQQVALAWLFDLAPAIVPLPGATTVEHARALKDVTRIRFDDRTRERLDERYPAGRLLRTPRDARRPAPGADADVVLVMGLAGAGKSDLAAELVERGYVRLNRDEAGGSLAGLLAPLAETLAAGKRHVVLDNTYLSRASRNAVIETAWRHRVPVRCLWLDTPIEQAQTNAVLRLFARHGRLLEPDELKRAARRDPGTFGPQVQWRQQRELDPPEMEEGFESIERREFVRRAVPGRSARAVVLWCDGVLRASRSGAARPVSADDVALLPGRAETLRAWHDRGYALLGIAWHPEIAAGQRTVAEADAIEEKTRDLLGVPFEALYCTHADGPAVCWCRKPLPGLGVALIERHALDPTQSIYVGADASDASLARRVGFDYRTAQEFFDEASSSAFTNGT
jgi:aryl-alcohol dehydrogenase-like predicted oxidoreductase/histidinol phosphatase-like enzyme/predicted kinase